MRKYEAYRNGATGWNEMVDYNSESPAVEKLPVLRDQLIQQGYDIIFLDFSDGATHIQSNAMTLVELLDYINNPANRAPGATETIVAAASMGGQVARFALAWMEQQGLCHNAKLYVSIDSPHRGANIPLGLQYMIDRLSGVLVGGSSFDMQRDKLLRPASQQMLVYHFSPTAKALRDQWQGWQASPGSYPSLLRKVAIADGARLGQALPGAYPGMELLVSTGAGNFFGGWGDNIANSLPGAGSRGNDNVIFRFHRPYEFRWKWHYTQVNSSYPTYDQAPGGTRPTTKDAENDSGFLGNNTLQSRSDYQTFIPIISALDVAAAGSIYSPNLYYNVDRNINSNRPDPSKYAFEAYYAPIDLSEPHINITDGQPSQQTNPTYNSNNVAWLLNELRESAHNLPAVLSGTYNYGSLYRRLLPTVEVAAGGRLFINNASLPNSGGVNTANDPKENSLEVYTSSCGSRVQVSQSGALTLGQPNDTRTASVRIGTNSLLDLRSGGVATVNAGSVLRIVRGGTLVVRRGARLAIGGQVIVEEGAYVCVEDPASIVTTGSGSYAPSPAATYYANPALGLGTLACTTPTVAPLSVSITSLVYQPYCLSNSGRNNYAQWTAAASGGVGSYVYSWELDAGSGYQPYGTPGAGYTTFGICLNGFPPRYVLARVTVRSGTQQASDVYYASPQMVLYPNPAEESVTVANDTDDGSPQARNAQAGSTTQSSPAPAGGPGTPMHVTVYNGQGRQVFAAANVTEATLRIVVKSWPAGLYQVDIRRGNTNTRHQLSVQH